MDRLLLLVVVAGVAILAAIALQGRRSTDPLSLSWPIPKYLDRSDFGVTDNCWLVVVFSSITCSSCASVVTGARLLEGQLVTVREVPLESAGEVHGRYQVEAVPMLVIADPEGLVRAHHVGPSTPDELADLLESARLSQA